MFSSLPQPSLPTTITSFGFRENLPHLVEGTLLGPERAAWATQSGYVSIDTSGQLRRSYQDDFLCPRDYAATASFSDGSAIAFIWYHMMGYNSDGSSCGHGMHIGGFKDGKKFMRALVSQGQHAFFVYESGSEAFIEVWGPRRTAITGLGAKLPSTISQKRSERVASTFSSGNRSTTCVVRRHYTTWSLYTVDHSQDKASGHLRHVEGPLAFCALGSKSFFLHPAKENQLRLQVLEDESEVVLSWPYGDVIECDGWEVLGGIECVAHTASQSILLRSEGGAIGELQVGWSVDFVMKKPRMLTGDSSGLVALDGQGALRLWPGCSEVSQFHTPEHPFVDLVTNRSDLVWALDTQGQVTRFHFK